MNWKLPDLSQNLWSKYGFMANPFDINALSQNRNTLLPVSEAIVGRDFDTKESKLITSILRNPGGGRVVVTGNIGVGKTTFINYHRYIWENHAQDKLFTTCREIVVTEEWRLRHFLVNIICSIVDKLLQVKGEKEIVKIPVLRDILTFSRIFYHTNFSVEASVVGFGGGFGLTEQANVPPVIPEMQLLQYLHDTVFEIKKMGYSGIFLHIDNLELFSRNKLQKAQTFFEEIRDCIQIPNIYFVFVASKGFFQEVISPLERVRSIFFGRPVVIPSLSKKQVLEAIHKRYEILAIKEKDITLPIEDTFIEYLYDLYCGKLRYIMDAMNMILPEFESTQVKTISMEKAKQCLSDLVKEHVQNNLTTMEWKIFLYCLEVDSFTNTALQKQFDMRSSNVTRVIKRLLDLGFVYLEKKEARSLLYKVNEYTKIINYRTSNARFSGEFKYNHSSSKTPIFSIRLEKAIKIIQKKKRISNKEYVDLLSVSSATATRDLKKLMEMGITCVVGKGRSRCYELAK